MTDRELEILKNEETRELIENNVNKDPVELAFSLKCGRESAALVCTQVKYLQRAASKLPSYHAARCVIPPLSYEQSSSETAAGAKNYHGKLCIDLTCGLGVDSFYFSKCFDKVVSVERDPVLADIARYNFGLLGSDNITVVNSSAEDYIGNYDGPEADIIYVDPARRDDRGGKVFLLQECSPDVSRMAEKLISTAKKALIKLSPLFDVEEALKVFSPHVSKIEIVSVGNETKELLVELEKEPTKTAIIVNTTSRGVYEFTPEDIGRKEFSSGDISDHKHLLIPDVGFYKGRLVGALFRKYHPGCDVVVSSDTGFCFSVSVPHDFCGRAYKIDGIAEYQPKKLKRILKDKGTKRINLLKRDFPHAAEEVLKALGVASGGETFMAFTEASGKKYALFLSRE